LNADPEPALINEREQDAEQGGRWGPHTLYQVVSRSSHITVILVHSLSTHSITHTEQWMRSCRVVKRLAVNTEAATVLGSIPAVESEGRQIQRC
jgi:hypothetical protein